MTELDQRLYEIMGKKLYEARNLMRGLPGNVPAPVDAVTAALDAMDNLYALLSGIMDGDPE